jgi:DNA-binding MarR family transcriptional regulator
MTSRLRGTSNTEPMASVTGAASASGAPGAPGAATPARGMQAWIAVVRAYQLCDSVLQARLSESGVKIAQHEILINLLRAPGVTQQELATHCFVAKSGVSMLITQLESLGWVVRRADPVDARVKRVYLTAKGARLAEKTRRVQAQVVDAMAESVSDPELAMVNEVMQRVSSRLSRMIA